MTCNAIATITVETAANLKDLQDNPNTIAAFQALLPGYTITHLAGRMRFRTSDDEFSYDGRNLSSPSGTQPPQHLIDAIKAVGGVVAQQKARATFLSVGKNVSEQVVGNAILLTCVLNNKKSRVVIQSTGKVSIFIDEGSYPEAKRSLAALVEQLGANLEIGKRGNIERHRHDLQVTENPLAW